MFKIMYQINVSNKCYMFVNSRKTNILLLRCSLIQTQAANLENQYLLHPVEVHLLTKNPHRIPFLQTCIRSGRWLI